jgi:branched-chain amino acid transport system substrate-binding protein
MKGKKLGGIFLIAVLLIGLISGCSSQPSENGSTGDTIKIGFLGAKTGNVATYGINTLKGMKLAAEEINNAGGVLGKKIEIIEADNRGDRTEIANIMQKFITKDKVVAIIGDPTTGGTKVAAPIAQSNQVVLLSAGAAGEGVVEIGDYIFRNTLLDSVAAPITAKYVIEELKWDKAALVTSLNNDFSVGLSKIFAKAIKELGGEIVIEESIQDGDTDFSAQVTKIKEANPEVIIFTGYYTEAALFLQEARRQGLEAKMVAGDGCLSPDLIKLGGDAVEGSFVYCGFSPDQPTAETQKFIEAVKGKYNEEPDMFVAQGYDAVKILAAAMEKANSIDPKVFRDALAQTKNFPGVSGVTTFRENREPIKSPVYLLTVKDGKFTLQAKLPVKLEQ